MSRRTTQALWACAALGALIAAPAWAAAERDDALVSKSGGKLKAVPSPSADASQVISPEDETEHVVRPGETLGGVANRARVPRVLIIEANRLKPPYEVRAGQRLVIPRTRRHVVKPGETGFDIAIKYGVPFSAISVANGLPASGHLRIGQTLLIPSVIKPSAAPAATPAPRPAPTESPAAAPAPAPRDDAPAADDARPPKLSVPVQGVVRRGFVDRATDGNVHDGLDIVAPADTAVRAAAGGLVAFAGREPLSFGNVVVIDHGNGWQTAYGFLSKITVQRGDRVKATERVGMVGHTGKATRDELHFELRHRNKPVNPVPFLPKMKGVATGGAGDTGRAAPLPSGRPASSSPSGKQKPD
ncbi:peptidoglycan DD-metalloendopeptidase family protein [Novosphingobium sp. FSY-8]|uniref:Peptidoglycan DD-metalloendopeptidase family protein n=1 Tax=Novosphingobium ovatum TaxID=1908523 RepID=A0ABW9X967_9SPHN|nr:M23 family metallopeptidase [Novosphingobium ovatum]NBC35055.1 peptidoglycan DD-metalloendopeptidase family protein [Novosphingobium ovatum]